MVPALFEVKKLRNVSNESEDGSDVSSTASQNSALRTSATAQSAAMMSGGLQKSGRIKDGGTGTLVDVSEV